MDAELSGLGDVVVMTSAPQQIADHIMSSIAVGALPVGTALPPERELAAAMQVSRSSVRAALDRLERGGLIERRRGRGGGTFVTDGDARALSGAEDRLQEFHRARVDLLDARAIVQNRAAHLAALRRTDAEVEHLAELAADYATHDSAAAARRADARFHHAVATAGHNPEIVRIVTDLDRRINTGFRHDPFSPELFARACADHSAIVAAIRDRDADEAGRLCEEHFRATTMMGA
ncbi:FadR/GntR family transcriptional regulator [Brevibacterium ihuae]|uniref:FadR/GntR family transcriptional regulator n=1 Tax=Brevibacterium ihuae TaxID=1631743 RepID=UPI000C76F55D|nr:FCD domain-containing protein [Brevibacterium ihuae]